MTPAAPLDPPRDARPDRGGAPWPLINQLADGDDVTARYVVLECRKLQTRAGQPYLKLTLGDRTGTIDGMVWEEVERWEAACAPKSIVEARGKVSLYQDRPQLRVTRVEAVEPAASELEFLVPASRRDRDLMERELDAWIASVRDRGLRGLLRRCLGRETDLGRAFREHPAATRNHHAFLYGLLEHTLSVTGACDRLAEHYREQGVRLDRDLLLTGALLHDIGKVRELDAPPAAVYTTPGKLLGHIVIGLQIVATEGARVGELSEEHLLLVQHLVASHQGKPEWDSPREPQTIEALILHYADDLDAKMNRVTAVLEDVKPGAWSEYDRSLGRSFYRPDTSNDGDSSRGGRPDDAVIDLFRG